LFGIDFFKRFDKLGDQASKLTESPAPLAETFGGKAYIDLSPTEKLNAIRSVLRNFGDREDINRARLIYEQEIKNGSLFGQRITADQEAQANDIIEYLKAFGDDPLGDIDPNKKEEFLKQLSTVSLNPKELSKKVSSVENVNNVSGGSRGGNANNVAVLPMGNNSKESLVRNDTGGLTSGPTMKIHSNFDPDNFIASINRANLNIV